MLKRVKIERVLGAASSADGITKNDVIPFGADSIAGAEIQSARAAICLSNECGKMQDGKCRECCGGVPIPVKVRLIWSQCPSLPKKW